MSQRAASLVCAAVWRQCRKSRMKLTVGLVDVICIRRGSNDGNCCRHDIVDGIGEDGDVNWTCKVMLLHPNTNPTNLHQ
jgi:hypothetical protein